MWNSKKIAKHFYLKYLYYTFFYTILYVYLRYWLDLNKDRIDIKFLRRRKPEDKQELSESECNLNNRRARLSRKEKSIAAL